MRVKNIEGKRELKGKAITRQAKIMCKSCGCVINIIWQFFSCSFSVCVLVLLQKRSQELRVEKTKIGHKKIFIFSLRMQVPTNSFPTLDLHYLTAKPFSKLTSLSIKQTLTTSDFLNAFKKRKQIKAVEEFPVSKR